jgi:hypothetical protein
MSHVEPRQNYMYGNIAQPLTPTQQTYSNIVQQNPYTGYAIGGRIGYAQAGPVMPGTLPILENRKIFDEQQKALQQQNREQLGIQSIPIKRNEGEGFLSSIFGPSADEKLLIEKGILSPDANARERIDAIKNLRLARATGAETEKYASEDISLDREPKLSINKYKTKEGQDTDPRENIRKEADMLKGLLKDEGLTTAENALIIARALAVPGGIGAKIAAAGELAMPVIKERAKIDREAVLKAYETDKEITKAKISAGASSAQMKGIEESIRSQINLARDRNEVTYREDGTPLYNGLSEADLRERAYSQATGKYTAPQLQQATTQVEDAKRKLIAEKAKAKPDPNLINKYETIIKIGTETFRLPKANGGRINKAAGGMSIMYSTTEDTTDGTTTQPETVVDTNVDGFPMKPVQKLSFEEIRNRLPKEITDDIVRLISNSSEALQDFAYIKTQQDVNQFNVKYGVNLVLPQNV